LTIAFRFIALCGANKFYEENLHHDSRDDNYLDVCVILRIDEVLEHHVLKRWLSCEILGQHEFFDLSCESPKEIINVGESIFDAFALLSVCLPLQEF